MKFEETTIENLIKELNDAPAEQKSKKIIETMQKIAEEKYANVIAEYQKEYNNYIADNSNDEKFGLRSLTDEEKQWIDMYVKQEDTSSLNGRDEIYIPQTTVNYVFEDLKKQRPLFNYIDWAPAGVQKWFLSEKTGVATWGKLTAAIVEKVQAEVSTIDLEANSLSAFMFVPKAIITLGYKWIDKFIRTVLLEVNEDGIQTGAITGNGKDAPIGYMKDLDGAVVNGVYPDRTAVEVTDLGPDSFGENVLPILNRDGDRDVDEILIIANQNEIDTKIYKATHVKTSLGYVKAEPYKKFVFIPCKDVPANKAIAALPNKYVMGISKMGIDYSDHYKFLEQLRTYTVLTYGNGRLKSNDDAVLMDITNLKALVQTVEDQGTVNTVVEEGEGA
ncbi:MAG: phage major capsid protein [Clostridia bacterium]|nr:phage major capsid protein [Clostridia bacterium]